MNEVKTKHPHLFCGSPWRFEVIYINRDFLCSHLEQELVVKEICKPLFLQTIFCCVNIGAQVDASILRNRRALRSNFQTDTAAFFRKSQTKMTTGTPASASSPSQ